MCMKDLNIKIINIRRTYNIAMGNILKVAYKEFNRVLGGKGIFVLPTPFPLPGGNEIVSIQVIGEEVHVETSSGLCGLLKDLHQDVQADLYVSLIPVLR